MFKGVMKAVIAQCQNELVTELVHNGECQVDGIGNFTWDKHQKFLSFAPSIELEAKIVRERRMLAIVREEEVNE